MRIIFWENTLSPHESAYIRALANKENIEVALIVEKDISRHRKNMGWDIPNLGNVKVLIHPGRSEIFHILKKAEYESVHIFSGIRTYPLVKTAFLQSLSFNIIRGISTESADLRGLKGVFRLGLGKLEAFRFCNKINFVLAIGNLGVQWFQKCGFSEDKIYPFGYFVENFSENKCDLRKNIEYRKDKYHLLFIGQLIKRKGVDILLKALSGLKEMKWFLDIIGDGKERRNIEDLCESLNLSKYVKFYGVKKNMETIEFLKTVDLLILPSRFDGWGAVVNEALTNGVPIVCSDACGAADLINNSFRGDVFTTESISDLRQILSHRILLGKKTLELSSKIKKWSRVIEGETAANYLLDVINSILEKGEKPKPPWRK